MSAIARLMLERLGKPVLVAEAASATEDRIRDRLMGGEERQVLAEIQDETLDLEALASADWRDPTW
ncbi:hypothetical protein DVA67_034105 [Solirubrobacter sp. CPCC 204708]|uniref:Uncharacterized protein n=1 Tax=Solirubrobacter deserti TaxID=2282478 RepID=A0ABT4RVL6_9ACTN|nr:hypothetical protein [Solirubrobacter deserti]MBE2321032.1 hypothetical protein [Solirubrobacter deserti]MDA0142576.1 hypothetical protein [Solirubrobacter deserti]